MGVLTGPNLAREILDGQAAASVIAMEDEIIVQELQAIYYQDLMDWTREAGLLCFVFEAFDEPWKGSPDPLEPEKHWGLFYVDRSAKLAMRR